MIDENPVIVNGYAYPSVEPAVLDAWLPDLTLLSSFSYGFRDDGRLIELDDTHLRNAAANANVQTFLVLTPLDETGIFNNELVHRLLSSEAAQTRLIQNLAAVMREKSMFGVDFDFEYILAEDRELYVNLIANAAEYLNNEGFLVTTAVAPKTSDNQPGLLYQGLDYQGIGQASNFVLLMTYEWGYTYGPPLPVAPLPSVRRVLDYGVSRIPPDKILMGIPNYGYDWTLPFVIGESRAEKISNDEAVSRAMRYGAEIIFDEEYMSPYYYYYDSNGLEHVVWFEDAKSWSAKFRLVSEYGFAGISFWNIMYDFPSGQNILRNELDILKI